jgi:aminopeptidase N
MRYKTWLSGFFAIVVSFTNVMAQRIDPHAFDSEHLNQKNETLKALSNDERIDVKFYHLDLEISLDSTYLSGNVGIMFEVLENNLDNLSLDLDSTFSVDSVSSPVASYSQDGNQLNIELESSYTTGDLISFIIYYKGNPPLAGGYKGLRYETHDADEIIIASLSTPYLAHTWWPCKDGLTDKADSTFIDITIKDSLINSVPIIALSNGLLVNTEVIGTNKKFKWRHHYPIVPYYVMVAISNYKHFDQTYIGDGYTFPMDYYVFDSHLTSAQSGTEDMPDVMSFFEEIFGPYPFKDEKYAMTQLGYYGGIENQTNSIVNNMSDDWFYVSVHELAHQWFADMITCETWNDGWLNEGFSSYAEALYFEHINGIPGYHSYMNGFEYYDVGTPYMEDVSNPFTLFQPIIYDKGAYILHMLRGVIGDEDFFEALKSYATNAIFKYDNANTQDFQQICQSVSGQDLDYFFEQWIYDEGYPQYKYNFWQDLTMNQVNVSINQEQGLAGWRTVFEMPVQLKFSFVDLTDSSVIVYNNEQYQSFSFDFDKEVVGVTLDPDKWILKNAQFDENIELNIKDEQINEVQTYPNPVKNELNIVASNFDTFSLRNIQGSIVDKGVLLKNENGLMKLDISSLVTGIYLLHLSSEKESIIKRIQVVD